MCEVWSECYSGHGLPRGAANPWHEVVGECVSYGSVGAIVLGFATGIGQKE